MHLFTATGRPGQKLWLLGLLWLLRPTWNMVWVQCGSKFWLHFRPNYKTQTLQMSDKDSFVLANFWEVWVFKVRVFEFCKSKNWKLCEHESLTCWNYYSLKLYFKFKPNRVSYSTETVIKLLKVCLFLTLFLEPLLANIWEVRIFKCQSFWVLYR